MRYAEWCTAAPSLEADIAAAAMGLDDLGHSRVLYGCLTELGANHETEASMAERYAGVAFLDQPWTDWSQFVAANVVLDTAFTLMIEAMANGSVELLRTRLRKMLQEERYHYIHGRSWAREANPLAAIHRAWQEAIEWFGPEGGDVDELHRTGTLGLGTREIRASLAEKLGAPTPELAIDWRRWDPIRRRTNPGTVDRRTFEMIRGLAERRYMPAGGERKNP